MRGKNTSRAGFSLLTTVVGLGALLCIVWWLAERQPAVPRASLGAEAAADGVALASLHLPGSVADAADAQRTPVAGETKALAEEPARATISGRLQIDGFAPYHGKVHFQQENGAWEQTAAIDPYGRFYLEQVPAATLALSFEAEGLEERRLLLPNAFLVTPTPNEIEFVDLDWKTRQLNVQVVSGDDPSRQAKVDIEGPNYRASFDTNELGKARLSVVGNGLFSLRAELSSGRGGEATLELEEGDELDTVVIATAPR